MRLLPTETRPPQQPIELRHEPAPTQAQRGYRLFAPCLKWEFGFTCPFCLLHQADLVGPHSVEKTGLSTVEHFIPKSVRPDLINEFENLVLACRLCNIARGVKPLAEENGAKLLNPREEAWAEHFTLEQGQLEPQTPDGDYTKDAYGINDRFRTARRSKRALVLTKAYRVLLGIRRRQRAVEKRLAAGDTSAREHLRDLEDSKRLAIEIALGFRWIPEDAPPRCRCDHTDHHDIPVAYRDQIVELDLEGL